MYIMVVPQYGSKEVLIVNKNTALLIIDVQVSMFSSINNTSVHNSDMVLDRICHLLEKARKAGTKVIFIQHTDSKDEEYTEGMRTWHLHPKIQPLNDERIIRKSTRDSFYNTSLHEELKQCGIDKLVIAGMQTEYCVNSTLLRAMELGYECTLAEDAHSTFDRHNTTAKQIIKEHNRVWKDKNIILMPSQEIEFIINRN